MRSFCVDHGGIWKELKENYWCGFEVDNAPEVEEDYLPSLTLDGEMTLEESGLSEEDLESLQTLLQVKFHSIIYFDMIGDWSYPAVVAPLLTICADAVQRWDGYALDDHQYFWNWFASYIPPERILSPWHTPILL